MYDAARPRTGGFRVYERFRTRGKLRAIGAIGGLATVLALPATGLGAVAAVQDDVLATAGLERVEERLNLVKASGAKVTRVDIFWSTVAPTKPSQPSNPSDPAYNWATADAVFVGLKARKVI